LLFKKNHKIPFVKRFSDFETDDGRPFAGADASRIKIGDFIAFFLKPLSVILPFAARFIGAGDSAPRAGARSINQRKLKP